MKRTPLPPRRTPLKRSTKPIARVSAKRAATGQRTTIARSPIKRTRGKPKRFAHRRVEGYPAFIREFPCEARPGLGRWFVLTGAAKNCSGRVQCAHVVHSRGAGGDDLDGCVPLCRTHHRQHDQVLGPGPFCALYGLDLERSAKRYGDIWRAQRTEGA